MWRCASDTFGYCSGEPDWETPPEIRENADGAKVTGTFGGKCKNNKDECEKFKSFTQLCPANEWVEPSEIRRILVADPNTKADSGQQANLI